MTPRRAGRISLLCSLTPSSGDASPTYFLPSRRRRSRRAKGKSRPLVFARHFLEVDAADQFREVADETSSGRKGPSPQLPATNSPLTPSRRWCRTSRPSAGTSTRRSRFRGVGVADHTPAGHKRERLASPDCAAIAVGWDACLMSQHYKARLVSGTAIPVVSCSYHGTRRAGRDPKDALSPCRCPCRFRRRWNCRCRWRHRCRWYAPGSADRPARPAGLSNARPADE